MNPALSVCLFFDKRVKKSKTCSIYHKKEDLQTGKQDIVRLNNIFHVFCAMFSTITAENILSRGISLNWSPRANKCGGILPLRHHCFFFEPVLSLFFFTGSMTVNIVFWIFFRICLGCPGKNFLEFCSQMEFRKISHVFA